MGLIFSCYMIEITPQRFERKYSFSVADLPRFWDWNSSSGVVFEVAYPDRLINNIYFESPEWNNYHENLGGISQRCKCRVRWYGDAMSPIDMRFEVKRRRNSIGDKLVQKIPDNRLALLGTGKGFNDIYRDLREYLDPELRLMLDQSHVPLLFNNYRRQYYSTKDGVRLTVDTNLQFESFGNFLNSDRYKMVRSQVYGFIEVKYSVDQRSFVEHYLKELPLRATRNSKYVIGIEHLYG